METKTCEICGKTLPLSAFSKSYKGRCKECVARLTKEKRNGTAATTSLMNAFATTKVIFAVGYTSKTCCQRKEVRNEQKETDRLNQKLVEVL